jgi:hypothetical protein
MRAQLILNALSLFLASTLFLEQMAILQPSAASCSAQPRPSPLVAAMTNAILSLILKSMFNLFVRVKKKYGYNKAKKKIIQLTGYAVSSTYKEITN